jgi:hypothetical protein
MSGTLLQEEEQSDIDNGLAPGTMEYIGAQESSQGTNLGSIGNIFQVIPSTAENPGYGLSSVDGNDPESVGAYVAALTKADGSESSALSQYSGGAYNGSNIASVLASFGISLPGSSSSSSSSSPPLPGASSTLGSLGGSGSGSGSSGTEEQLGTFISGWVIRIIIAVGGLICIAVALSMFKTTAPIVTAVTTPAKRIAKGAAEAAAAA